MILAALSVRGSALDDNSMLVMRCSCAFTNLAGRLKPHWLVAVAKSSHVRVMAHTFISYVREDTPIASYIADILAANGVEPWLDTEQIGAGERWKSVLKAAIQSGDRFVAIFSPQRDARERSVAHEELLIAIEELRLRPIERAWFIAIVLPGSSVPDHPIGGGASLRDLQYIDVAARGWPTSVYSLLAAHGVRQPAVDIGVPLAPGFGDRADIIGGSFVVRNFRPASPVANFDGAIFHVTEGACERGRAGKIFASFNTTAPNEALQLANERLGFAEVRVETDDDHISTDADAPTVFRSDRVQKVAAGTKLSVPALPSVVYHSESKYAPHSTQ